MYRKRLSLALVVLLAMVLTTFTLSSCSKEETDKQFESFILTNPWVHSGSYCDQDRYWKYLRLTNEHQFTLVEVQNAAKYITTGNWEVKDAGKTFVLNATDGDSKGSTIVMNMLDTYFTEINFTVNGHKKTMIQCKSKDIEDFIKSEQTPYNWAQLLGTWENSYQQYTDHILRYLQLRKDRSFTLVEQQNDGTKTVSEGKWSTLDSGSQLKLEYSSGRTAEWVAISQQPEKEGMLKLDWYYEAPVSKYITYELWKVDDSNLPN